jgi:hypothetical protein
MRKRREASPRTADILIFSLFPEFLLFEEADTAAGGVSCRDEGNFQTNTSGRQSDWPRSLESPTARSAGRSCVLRRDWSQLF